MGHLRPQDLDVGGAPRALELRAVPHRARPTAGTAASRTCSCRWTSPGSRCDRSATSPAATPTSARCSTTVPVPTAENVVGEVDGGWRVAMSTVTFERGLSTVGYQLSFEEELRTHHRTGAAQRPARRPGRAPAPRGRVEPGPDPAVEPPAHDELARAGHHRAGHQRVQALLGVVPPGAGRAGASRSWAPTRCWPGPGPHPFDPLQTMFMYSRAETIYGGSHQIQRNIVGERELGPAEGAVTRRTRSTTCAVVDLSSGISGAYCTKLLADAGADVVKVERPAGDPFRAEAALFALLHTSKRNADARSGPWPTTARVLERAGRRRRRRRHRSPPRARGVARVRRRRRCAGGPRPSWWSRSRGSVGVDRGRTAPATEFTLQAWCGSIASRGRKHEPPVATGGRIGEWVAGIGRRRRRAGRAARRAPQRARARSSTCRRSRR